MALHDVTLELHAEIAGYPGDPPVRRWCYRELPHDAYEASMFTFGAHAGTHLDAPSHFFPGGLTVSEVPLEWLCGRARVLDLRGVGEAIDRGALEAYTLDGVERLLLRTVTGAGLAAGRLEQKAHLTPDAASYLLERGELRLVGIDALSIESAEDPKYTVHHLLLGAAAPVLVLEGLALEQVTPGDYELMCLPLRFRGAEAAPVRAILRDLAEDG